MCPVDFEVPSSKEGTVLHCMGWPVDDPIATLQIVHGMTEHISVYATMAEYLNTEGIAVFGHDQLGHGDTSPNERGFIAENGGDDFLVEDVRQVADSMRIKYPGIPNFILGHSMGSYILRRFITEHGDIIQGAVLVGVGNPTTCQAKFVKTLLKVLMTFKGPKGHSEFLEKLMLGRNDSRYETPGIRNQWLSPDEEVLNDYNSDEKSQFKFTLSAYKDLMNLIIYDNDETKMEKIPKTIPLLFLSGAEDAHGEYGKKVNEVSSLFRKNGIQTKVILYEGQRHNLSEGKGTEMVFKDLTQWIKDNV